MSPTQRTLAQLRARGYHAEVVERWNAFAKIRQDLFGCIDVLGVGALGTIAVQTTSWAHVPDRERKVRGNPALQAMLAAGWRVEVHGWRGRDLRSIVIE